MEYCQFGVQLFCLGPRVGIVPTVVRGRIFATRVYHGNYYDKLRRSNWTSELLLYTWASWQIVYVTYSICVSYFMNAMLINVLWFQLKIHLMMHFMWIIYSFVLSTSTRIKRYDDKRSANLCRFEVQFLYGILEKEWYLSINLTLRSQVKRRTPY